MNPKNKDNIKRSTIEGEHQNRYWKHLSIQATFMSKIEKQQIKNHK